jgi:inhibitor of KinA
MVFSRYGEDAVRVVFGEHIDPEVHEKVRNYYYFIKSVGIEGVIDVIPSFTSCVIHFDDEIVSFDELCAAISERRGDMSGVRVPPPSRHDIPVRYGGEYGPDMGFICSYTGLTEDEVIEIHASSAYTVFAVGFMPGFPYLGTLDRRLFTPRLDTPRLKVPEGSVGVAQLQTGIYSFESPSGWRILGKTDARLFDYRKEPFSLFKIGDTVRFVRI